MRLVIRALVIGGVVLATLLGCAPAVPNPFSTPEVEAQRALCLAAGGTWVEVQEAYACLPPGQGPPQAPAPTT